MTTQATTQPAATEAGTFTTRDFRLQSGVALSEVTIAYRTLGKLSPARDNLLDSEYGHVASGRNWEKWSRG